MKAARRAAAKKARPLAEGLLAKIVVDAGKVLEVPLKRRRVEEQEMREEFDRDCFSVDGE